MSASFDRKLNKLNKLKREQNQWKNKQQEYMDNQYNITTNITNLLKPVSEVKEQIKASKVPQTPLVNKINSGTDPRPALEYHKPRAIKEITDDGTFSYYDQAVEDEIKNKEAENFAYFNQFARQENCGYYLKLNEFYIGTTKIDLRLINNDEQVEVLVKQNKYTFFKHVFEDLFGSGNMPDFYDTIDKGSFFLYYYLLKECKIGKIHRTRANPLSAKGEFINTLRELMTRKLDNEQETELLIMVYNDLSKNITLEQGKDYIEKPEDEEPIQLKPNEMEPIINREFMDRAERLQTKPPIKKGKGIIILPLNVRALRHRLDLILSEIKAGNNSNVLKDELSAIVDELKKRNAISTRYEKMILFNLL